MFTHIHRCSLRYLYLQSKDEIDSWPLKETTLYIGVDRDKKPLTG